VGAPLTENRDDQAQVVPKEDLCISVEDIAYPGETGDVLALFRARAIKLIIGGALFLCTFIPITLSTKTVNQTDINNLREMLSELGPIRHLPNFLLSIIEKLIIIFHF
jgi:hypothetical protein